MMRDSDQEELDLHQRSPGMEDNPMMTVEFLRARLLSERSVSKAARQKAGELAFRVAELEKQLKMVCIQRKKAEKATEDLIEILENHGITDVSEPYDSGSDQEREDDSSANSNLRRNDSDTYSGSELDSSTGNRGSLSWKGRKNSPHSLEKYKRSLRSGISSASFGSSSAKHRQGKSCRQIRRRELRSVHQDLKSSSVKIGSQENEVMLSEVGENSCDVGSENMPDLLSDTKDQRTCTISESIHLGNQRKAASGIHNFDFYERGKDMKEALEHQAQLIDQNEALEKAQIEWEEKFRDNDTGTLELCDPGNQSDITEDRDDCKEQLPPNTGALISKAHKEKSKVCLSKERSSMLAEDCHKPSNAGISHLQDQSSSRKPVRNSMQENAERNLPSHCSSGNELTSNLSPVGINGHKNESCTLVPYERPSDLGGVLDALQQAKLSLQQNITNLEMREVAPIDDRKVAKPSVPAARPWERSEIPIGCAGLFRIPTDFTMETQNQANVLAKTAGLSLKNYPPDIEAATKSGDRFMMETVSSFSGEDQLLGNTYTNTKQTIPPLKPYLSSCLDVTLPSSSRHVFSSSSSVPDLVPQMPYTEQILGHPLATAASKHPPEHFRFTDDRGCPDFYK